MKFFKAEFVMNDQVDHEGGADANSKAGDVDQGKDLVFPKIPDRNQNIAFKHIILYIPLPLFTNPYANAELPA